MMNRRGWLCPWLAIGLAAGVLVLWGLSWWTVLLAATKRQGLAEVYRVLKPGGHHAVLITFWTAVKAGAEVTDGSRHE